MAAQPSGVSTTPREHPRHAGARGVVPASGRAGIAQEKRLFREAAAMLLCVPRAPSRSRCPQAPRRGTGARAASFRRQSGGMKRGLSFCAGVWAASPSGGVFRRPAFPLPPAGATSEARIDLSPQILTARAAVIPCLHRPGFCAAVQRLLNPASRNRTFQSYFATGKPSR